MQFIITENGEKFAQAEITNVYEKKLGDIEESDYRGHEKYTSQEEMINTFIKFYGPKVDKNTVVKIINFKLL